MTSQLDVFDGGARKSVPEFPEGFRYRPELITPAEVTIYAPTNLTLHVILARFYKLRGM
jgi:hypothetical protein